MKVKKEKRLKPEVVAQIPNVTKPGERTKVTSEFGIKL